VGGERAVFQREEALHAHQAALESSGLVADVGGGGGGGGGVGFRFVRFFIGIGIFLDCINLLTPPVLLPPLLGVRNCNLLGADAGREEAEVGVVYTITREAGCAD